MKPIHPNILIIIIIFCSFFSLKAQNSCEQISEITFKKLESSIYKNDYSSILSNINTIESVCGINEFTLRTKIIYKIIYKENTSSDITQFLNLNLDEKLANRWDDAAEANFQKIYDDDKIYYSYLPLNHPIDSLLKLKAIAILNSESYNTINDNEYALLHLFVDDIEEYNELRNVKHGSKTDKLLNYQAGKEKHTFGVHVGSFMPIGENKIFSKSPIIGFSLMTPFENNFIGEINYKFRINKNANPFDFRYKGNNRSVASKSSHAITLGAGYKLLDKNKFILMPKLNLGYGFIWTGLSEVEYVEDDEGAEKEVRRYRNVNTVHSSLGLTFMYNIGSKKYIGFETNYHAVPYNWSKNLKTNIPANYASFEIFIRF